MSRSLLTIVLFVIAGVAHATVAAPVKGAKSDVPPARAATGDEISLLNEVLHRTADDYRRWAYTEHRVIRDEKGRLKSELVLRYDPSKPYAEQWTPIKVDGRDPSERD